MCIFRKPEAFFCIYKRIFNVTEIDCTASLMLTCSGSGTFPFCLFYTVNFYPIRKKRILIFIRTVC